MLRKILLILIILVAFFGFVANYFIQRDAWYKSLPFLAYTDPIYHTSEFLAEQKAFYKSFDWDEFGNQIPRDFHGSWFNVLNHTRQTIPMVDSPHKVFLFGDSAVYDLYNPDNQTIASYLQAIIGTKYQVINRGQSANPIATEYLFLHDTALHQGDLVIFYDGVPDTRSLMSNPDIDLMVQTYKKYDALARNYVESTGAKFYHFLQPTIWSMRAEGYEQGLIEIDPETKQGMDHWIIDSWPRLAATPHIIDFTHILDQPRAAGDVFFFDVYHVNGSANKLLASRISDYLLKAN